MRERKQAGVKVDLDDESAQSSEVTSSTNS